MIQFLPMYGIPILYYLKDTWIEIGFLIHNITTATLETVRVGRGLTYIGIYTVLLWAYSQTGRTIGTDR